MDNYSATPVRVASVPHDELRRGERPMSPDDDPFYRAPQGYEHADMAYCSFLLRKPPVSAPISAYAAG